MADEAAPLNPALIDAVRALDVPPDVVPGPPPVPASYGGEPRMGHARDMPEPNFVVALEAFDRDTDNRFGFNERPIPGVFDRDGRQATFTFREPLSVEEIDARNERRNALITNITRVGARKIADHFAACSDDAAALLGRLESLDEALAELEPVQPSRGLGEIGEYSSSEYGLKVARLLKERMQLLDALRTLEADVKNGEEFREAGAWTSGLAFLANSPALARRYVENLHATPGVEPVGELPAPPDAPTVSLDKHDSLRYRTGRRLERVETTYTWLRERDAMRKELTDADADRIADEAASAGASREVVTRLRPSRSA
jgi:hypothetical protein